MALLQLHLYRQHVEMQIFAGTVKASMMRHVYSKRWDIRVDGVGGGGVALKGTALRSDQVIHRRMSNGAELCIYMLNVTSTPSTLDVEILECPG